MERRRTVILAADAAGCSRLIRADDARTIALLQALRAVPTGTVGELEKQRDIAEPCRVPAAALACLGLPDGARDVAKRFLAALPDLSSAAWRRTQPFRNADDPGLVPDGYRLAELPP